jgi:hypothetical protein
MPSERYCSDSRVYEVQPEGPVFLTVTIGKGQVGGTSLHWHGRITSEGRVEKKKIGANNERLGGQVLGCTTRIRDVNPRTNMTRVTYRFEGGAKSESFPFEMQAAGAGGFVTFSIDFHFR